MFQGSGYFMSLFSALQTWPVYGLGVSGSAAADLTEDLKRSKDAGFDRDRHL